MEKTRERLTSRLGFILLAAGCAIGLGNIWRFPYVTGTHGGGLFVLMYLFFLAVLGMPVLVMELAIGRAGQRTLPAALHRLQNPASRFPWARTGRALFVGNLILLMFYSVVTAWLLSYAVDFVRGRFAAPAPGAPAPDFGRIFTAFLADPLLQGGYTFLAIAVTVGVCLGGVRQMIEKTIKVMMGGMLLLILILAGHSLQLAGTGTGMKFFLWPDLGAVASSGQLLATMHAAMAQAFFTLSIGIGSIAVCGSYTGREHTLPRESIWIIALDTTVALAAGVIIFPCCFTYGVSPAAGPALIFITLPQVFLNMAGGQFWGSLFFIFLAVAALSTLIAMFENLVAFGIDELGWSRRRSCLTNGAALAVLSLPCVFGFNLWRDFHPLGGDSTILDFEDFLVSDNLLPLGALMMTLFCTRKSGWGADGFYAEANTGGGWRLPRAALPYLRWILPLFILALWATGIVTRFWG